MNTLSMRPGLQPILLLLVLLVGGCSGSSLSTTKADQILLAWSSDVGSPGFSRNCPVTSSLASPYSVEGVHEVPAENMAKADIVFKDFTYGYTADCSEINYSGRGTATFAHYNDGRWVLKSVEFDNHVWKFDEPKYASE